MGRHQEWRGSCLALKIRTCPIQLRGGGVGRVRRKSPTTARARKLLDPRTRRLNPLAPRALAGEVDHFEARPVAKFTGLEMRNQRPPTYHVAHTRRSRIQQHLGSTHGRPLILDLLPIAFGGDDFLEPIGKAGVVWYMASHV